MDVVNDMHMGPPAITSLGGSLTSAGEVNSLKKRKMGRKKKKGKAVGCKGSNLKRPLRESQALPTLLSGKRTVEYNSKKKKGKRKRRKTEQNATKINVNGCSTSENTCSSKTSNMTLDTPPEHEHPTECVSIDSVTRQSCVEVSCPHRHNEEEVQNMMNKTAENSHGQCHVQEVSCNHISVVANPELFTKECVVVPLNIEHGIDDNSSKPEDKNDSLKNTSLAKKNDDPAVHDFSDKSQHVKTYIRRKRNCDCPSPENCNKEPTMQDYHRDDPQKIFVGPVTDDLVHVETKFSNDLVTLQSTAAGQEMELRADNTNEQRFMISSSVGQQHETNGRQLYHTEFTRNNQLYHAAISKISQYLLARNLASYSKNKLLILDLNGLLADFVCEYTKPRRKKYRLEPDFWIGGKKVFKRPFCDDFLQFCFDRFHVGVWSSRAKKNLDKAVGFLFGKSASKLLFRWNRAHCTMTGFTTVENKAKPLVLKEVRKLWEDPNLPWEKGEFNESNTLLLDDSPYKALLNPKDTAIFPYSYQYLNSQDSSLGPGGDLRVYLEGLAMAENVQKYVASKPFGQRPIREANASWGYYRKVIESVQRKQKAGQEAPLITR